MEGGDIGAEEEILRQGHPALDRLYRILHVKTARLTHGHGHVRNVRNRKPIEYDLHLPHRLALGRLAFDPGMSLVLTDMLEANFKQRKSIMDNSLDVGFVANGIDCVINDIVHIEDRAAFSEDDVRMMHFSIHKASHIIATLALFDVAPDDIFNKHIKSVFRTSGASGANTIADLLVGCAPTNEHLAHQWEPLWSAINGVEPDSTVDLRHPAFQVLHTEEYKNIRAGPGAILGIYIIILCMQKQYLKKWWPTTECQGCEQYAKSHAATDAWLDDGGPDDGGLDDKGSTDLLQDLLDDEGLSEHFQKPRLYRDDEGPYTDEQLQNEILRLAKVLETYDKDHRIPSKNQSRTAKQPEMSGGKVPQNKAQTSRPKQKPKAPDAVDIEADREEAEDWEEWVKRGLGTYEQQLQAAVDKFKEESLKDLPLSEDLLKELDKNVKNGGYMLNQVRSHMVRYDLTAALISCFNISVRLLRFRQKETLIISNFLTSGDSPILHSTALTAFAYKDAVQRFQLHKNQGKPHWIENPFHGQPLRDPDWAGKGDNDDDDEDQGEKTPGNGNKDKIDPGSRGGRRGGGGGGSGSGRGNGGRGGPRGGGGGGSGSGRGNGSGGPRGGGERQKRKDERDKGYPNKHNLKGLHVSFRAPLYHLWSSGFNNFQRVGQTANPVAETGAGSPKCQGGGPGVLESLAIEATFNVHDRRVSSGSTGSTSSTASGSTDSTAASHLSLYKPPSSTHTSPSTTRSMPMQSRDSSPVQKLRLLPAAPGVTSLGTDASVIKYAGVVIEDRVANECAGGGIIWSGKLFPENGPGGENYFVPVVVKMATLDDEANNDDSASATLREEGSRYEVLAAGDRTITPKYFGTFESKIGTVALVLAHGGTVLDDFKDVEKHRAQALFDKAVQMHEAGITHNNLIPRNIVQHTDGELTIIDLHIAGANHQCTGQDRCSELVNFREQLGL
ncbi:hypothetical protein R3P38DRAFT_2531117 [Favolaschia claudopus]|uniref:Protein kinase domain-containing protein n=1 Tax=Favolaschia claudopus TaxID=2862362 RepID=A0AAW0BGF1_9AGAR